MCDGVSECNDNTDEGYCPYGCDNGTTYIMMFQVCDDKVDCTDGADESNCS
jgi:hypothetical protein